MVGVKVKCLRCGYAWYSWPNKKGKPKYCAKCNSPYWNKPRKEPKC